MLEQHYCTRCTRILPLILLFIFYFLVIYLFLSILCKYCFLLFRFYSLLEKCMNVGYMNDNEYAMLSLILNAYFLYLNLLVIICIFFYFFIFFIFNVFYFFCSKFVDKYGIKHFFSFLMIKFENSFNKVVLKKNWNICFF